MSTEQYNQLEGALKEVVRKGNLCLRSIEFELERDADTAWIKRTLEPFRNSTDGTEAILEKMASEVTVLGLSKSTHKTLKPRTKSVLWLQKAYECEMGMQGHGTFLSSTRDTREVFEDRWAFGKAYLTTSIPHIGDMTGTNDAHGASGAGKTQTNDQLADQKARFLALQEGPH